MIYLDNNATTKISGQVLAAMMPYLTDYYANASSTQHKMGRESNQAVELARQKVADALSCSPKEIHFNSGSTESIYTVLKGISNRYARIGKHLIVLSTEHKATLNNCHQLEKLGYEITKLPVDSEGRLDLDTLKQSIRKDTILVSISWANNETGTIQQVPEIANICVHQKVLFFCDVTQYIGKMPMPDLSLIPIDMMCFSAHKIHGPKGVGALFVREKRSPIQLEPLVIGGSQENRWRGGTLDVPAIVGLGAAIENARNFDFSTIKTLRNQFENEILAICKEIKINSKEAYRLPNTSSITVKHVNNKKLMSSLPDLAFASGSACTVNSNVPSHVLRAMGISDEDIHCTVRFSLSQITTLEEVNCASNLLVSSINAIRQASPIWQMYQEGII